MNKFTIKNENYIQSFCVENRKYLLNKNLFNKDIVVQTFINYFAKLSDSEYSEENNISSNILFNDKELNKSDFNFFYINEFYDIDLEKKLGSKSLLLNFLKVFLDNIEYDDTFSTIGILVSDLLSGIEDNLQNDLDIETNLESNWTKEMLIKIIKFSFLKGGYEINNYNLNIDDRINLQLKMANYIGKNSDKRCIIILDLEEIDIKNLKLIDKNIILICIFKEMIIDSYEIDQIGIIDKNILDLSDPESFINTDEDYYEIDTIKKSLLEELKNYIFINK